MWEHPPVTPLMRDCDLPSALIKGGEVDLKSWSQITLTSILSYFNDLVAADGEVMKISEADQ